LILDGFVILSVYAILSVFSSIIYFPSLQIPIYFMSNSPLKVSSNAAYSQPAKSILYILCQGNLYSFPIRKCKDSRFSESRSKEKNI